jgi:hypothetical protein
MTFDESDKEFLEDFGATSFSDEELNTILDRARQSGDLELRRLVKQLQALRHISLALLERVEELPARDQDQVLKLARFIIRGEGGVGNPGV